MPESRAVNADPRAFVRVDTHRMDWKKSRGGGVWRKRLHLYGPAESGQVTSIVRYDPGSKFPEHAHPEGEEIFVLDGVFSDHTGDYGPGAYLLNPEGFKHAPFSEEGCRIFVKLRQYAGEGRRHEAIDTHAMDWQPGDRTGMWIKMLYVDLDFPDRTSLCRMEAGSDTFTIVYPGGAEILVLQGTLVDQNGRHPEGTWLRFPPGSFQSITAPEACSYYLKEGGVRGLRSPDT